MVEEETSLTLSRVKKRSFKQEEDGVVFVVSKGHKPNHVGLYEREVKWQSQRHMLLLKNSLNLSIPCLGWLLVMGCGYCCLLRLCLLLGLMINELPNGQHSRALLCYF
ncbi:hypothetical protein VNO80_15120 [Phaseolus coccineus]|uniref:Uncharacterized protein n=1 Tax=Phaseolus coccineus TaxID=3886 RepID=A0AAN9ML21_PHACN